MTRSTRTIAAAFSLVEVLISVLVLSLGMLGLGAVIPVVVRAQRIASEATLGTTAAASAEATLRVRSSIWGGSFAGQLTPQWLPMPSNGGSGGSDGAMRIEGLAGVAADAIPQVERLYPAAIGEETTPRFVWDAAMRRVGAGSAIEVAVFVRPVDPGIRLERGVNLARALTDPDQPDAAGRPSDKPARLASAVARQYRPTRDGVGVAYAQPYALALTDSAFESPASPTRNRREDDRDRLILDFDVSTALLPQSSGGGSAPIDAGVAAELAAQVGQRLVDSEGRIYAVEGIDRVASQSAGKLVVRIDPPVPASVERSTGLGLICFTPQVPAAVRVFEVQP